MKKFLALLMAIAMLVSIVACGEDKQEDVLDTNNPILRHTANIFDKFAKEGGTITLSAEGGVLDDLEEEFDISFESLEFKTDTEQALVTLNGKLGKTDLSESIYYGKGAIVVDAPAFLGDAYGVDLDNLMEDLEDSYFADMIGGDMDEVEEILGMLEGVMNGEAGEMIPGLNVEELSATITELATKLIDGMNEIFPSKVTEKDGYTITTVTVTSDKFDELFDLIAELLEDKDLQDTLESINDTISEYTGEEIPFDELPDLVRHYGEMLLEAAEEYGIEATSVATTKVSKDGMNTEISLTCEVAAEEYDLEGSIEYVVTEKMVDTSDKFEHTMTAELSVDGLFKEGLGGQAGAVLEVMEKGMVLETKWNKKSGDITMTEEMGDMEVMSLEGNLKLSNTEMTFVLENIEMMDGMVETSDYIDNVTIQITAGKPKGLSVPDYTNVLDMSETKFMKLATEIMANIEDMGLEDIFGGSSYEDESWSDKDYEYPVYDEDEFWSDEDYEYPVYDEDEGWG